jgi:hypothetical protein
MTQLILDVFPAADPSGASLGTLRGSTDGAFDRLIRVHHNDVGEGRFTLNTHSSEAALASAGRYVRAKLTGGSYLFGFWMDTARQVVASAQEEGGEDIQWTGRGPLAYLERAALMPTKTASGPGTVGTDGNWSWTDQTIGAILDHVLADAVAVSPSGVPLLTWDFTGSTDSAGNAWDTIDDTFQLPVGMDVLAVISRFQSGGVTIRMTHDFVLSAWNDPPGADLSGQRRLRQGRQRHELGRAPDQRLAGEVARHRPGHHCGGPG